MTLARRSRSASACRPMARCICSGISTCLTSTFVTLIPQGSVSWSRMICSLLFTFSRSARISSSSNWPTMLRSVVCAFCEVAYKIILHLRKREIRVHHAEIRDRVDLHRDVVARDDVLRRHVQRFDPQRNPVQRLDRPEDDAQARRPSRPAACARGAAPRRAPIP